MGTVKRIKKNRKESGLTPEELARIQSENGVILVNPEKKARCLNQQFGVRVDGEHIADIMADELFFTREELVAIIKEAKSSALEGSY